MSQNSLRSKQTLYRHSLSEGGDSGSRQCGWLKDRFRLSWQIVPKEVGALLDSSEPGKADRMMTELLKMKKPDIVSLRRA